MIELPENWEFQQKTEKISGLGFIGLSPGQPAAWNLSDFLEKLMGSKYLTFYQNCHSWYFLLAGLKIWTLRFIQPDVFNFVIN